MKKRPKVLVVGLDGMTAASLFPVLEAGHMPCMQRLMNEGCHGTLMSTMPPVTGLLAITPGNLCTGRQTHSTHAIVAASRRFLWI